ncbi:MAG: hypothetical protein IMW85_05915 [Thermicanus sp.]|nr:hypothetical protein [Thermicanus sp.]
MNFLFKTWAGIVTLAGLLLGLILMLFLMGALPLYVSLLIPAALGGSGYLLGIAFFPPKEELTRIDQVERVQDVLKTLSYIENRVIKRRILDAEITGVLAEIIEKVRFVLPYTEEMGLSEVKHTVRRLGTSDLIGLLNPYLRLSPSSRNLKREELLESLKDMLEEVKAIIATIEAKDIQELERKVAFIDQKYNAKDL